MDVLYARSECFSARRLPPSTGQKPPVPARLAHTMAHEKKQRSVRPRAAGYHRRGDDEPIAVELRQAFLSHVLEGAPSVATELSKLRPLAAAQLPNTVESAIGHPFLTDWYGLELALQDRHLPPNDEHRVTTPSQLAALTELHKNLLEWAERHYLHAEWVLSAAVGTLTVSALRDDRGDLRLYAYPFSRGSRVTLDEPFTFTAPSGIRHNEGLEAYQKRLSTELATALEAHMQEHRDHLKSVARQFEAWGHELVSAPIHDSRAKRALQEAAHWQVLGERPLHGDRETIRKLLRRLPLTPRPGL